MKNILVLVLMICAVSGGFAQHERMQRQQRQLDPAERASKASESLKEEIGLSDAKANEVELVFLKYNEIMKEKSQALRERMQGKVADREAMIAARDEMRNEMQELKDQRDAEMKEILSKKEYKEFLIWDEKREEQARKQMRSMRRGNPSSERSAPEDPDSGN